jgi:hypothetical protein
MENSIPTHLLHTGPTYLHASGLGSVSGATPYTYYVTASGDNYCKGVNSLEGRVPAMVTVKAISGPGDLSVSGAGDVCGATTLEANAPNAVTPVFNWYSNPEGGTPFYTGATYTTSALKADTTFYVTVSSDNYCEGTSRDTVKLTMKCFTIRGTVFPFVYQEGDDALNAAFPVTARLISVPQGNQDPLAAVERAANIRYQTTAVNYDGSVYVPGTPRHPGFTGDLNNPGYPIDWSYINKQRNESKVDTTTLHGPGQKPVLPIGLYTFVDVMPGEYILALKRAGFLPRYARITVASGGAMFIEHREIVGGDMDGDLRIDDQDVLEIYRRTGNGLGDPAYNARYDINGNGDIEIGDVSTARGLRGFKIEGYTDTQEWLDWNSQP